MIKKSWIPVMLLIGLLLIPIYFWVGIMPLEFRISSPGTIFLSLGQISALLGMTLFSINIILTSRLPIFDELFSGLNNMFIKHHLIGITAFVLLLWHPVMLVLSYFLTSSQAAADFILGLIGRPDLATGKAALLLLSFALILTLFIRLRYDIWKISHKLIGISYAIAFLHIFFVSSDISVNLPLKIYLIILSVMALSVYMYRSIFPGLFVKKYRYQISEIKKVNPDTSELILSPIRDKIDFIPGQFAFFTIPGLGMEEHPFSMSSDPTQKQLSIIIKNSGDYTSRIKNIKPGEIIDIEGPFGKFSWKKYQNANQVWIAGGVGITPFLSMATELSRNKHKNIDLYYSVRSKNDFIYSVKLQEIFSLKRLKYFPYITSVSGRLSLDYLSTHTPDYYSRQIYICGPSTMIKSITSKLKKAGISGDNIHSEEFSLQ